MPIALLVLMIAAAVNGILLVRTIFIILMTPRISGVPISANHSPSVSILLPARNEASRILELNVDSLVNQDYQSLEIIAVDDRSTDGTLQILRQFRDAHPKQLRVIEGRVTPRGWLGKLFALEQAKSVAKGEWLIMMDADVLYSREIVSSALDFVSKNGLDGISLLPQLEMLSFWEAVVMPAMSWLFLMRVSPTQANRKASRACFGLGHFVMFRRSAHDHIGGFAKYKGVILDDCATMELLKNAGHNVKVGYSPKLMRSRFYNCLAEIIQGFGKNSFASLRFSKVRVSGFVLYEIFVIYFPHVYALGCLILGRPFSAPSMLAYLSVMFFLSTVVLFGLAMRADYRGTLFYLLGHAICLFIVVYSAISFEMGGGVSWKGRSLEELFLASDDDVDN